MDDDDDNNEGIDAAGVDYNVLLAGIPKPWNLGPISMPPDLTGPLYVIKLKPEVIVKMQVQAICKLSIEYMETLVATVCAFPDDETCWNFAVLSNYWASKKLGCHYWLECDSEHCCLLFSRISQSCGRLVSAAFSNGICDFYTSLTWDTTATGQAVVEMQRTICEKVTAMIKDGSFTAAKGQPATYYQSEWFTHILKQAFFAAVVSKGLSNDPHLAQHFGSGISYPLFSLVATATEKMLAVVAAGLSTAKSSHKSPANLFSHAVYSPQYHNHIFSLARIHNSPTGPIMTKYLEQVHKELRAAVNPSIHSNPTLTPAIPVSALTDSHGVSSLSIATAPRVQTHSATGINLGAILGNLTLNNAQKLKILSCWNEVNDASDDSKVEAKCTRAVLDTPDQAQAAALMWPTESDGEEPKIQGKGKMVKEDDEAEIEVEIEEDGEGDEEEVESANKGMEGAKAEFSIDEDLEAQGPSGSEAGSTMENEGNANENESNAVGYSDDEPAPSTPHACKWIFFPGGSPPHASSSEEDGDSDGEGTSGTVATQVDVDLSMRTTAASDDEED
ncbi:unnamed protein product [Rhizoctonia solani]|uniref:DUF6532 domain-containing protein n=1 Tax=Rhizoctonia solani TaxID=456999 RepID=A0A8H3HMY4_9AGAM|nr:unnamed protein product [Rhizoctonia solani]